MPSISAKHIAFIGYPGVAPMDIFGPAQAFGAADEIYQMHLVKTGPGGQFSTDCRSLSLFANDLASLPKHIDTLIVPGGLELEAALRDSDLIAAVAALAPRSRRIASVCVGAFLLAEAGLLHDRRVVTHWRACDDFAERYPNTKLEQDAIWVQDGNIWSSAGISAGIDLSLALIEDDLGAEVAAEVARELVVFLRRPGGQLQFSRALAAQAADATGPIKLLLTWISDNLDKDLRVEKLAAQAGMSERTFVRTFRSETGSTPAKVVECIRVDAARSSIERSRATFGEIARRYGFGEEQNMRRSFQRRLNASPQEIRERFFQSEPK